MVLLDAGTARTSAEIYSEDADGETQIRNHKITSSLLWPLSYIAQKLSWEGVEFVQLVYCIIVYSSFLNSA